jgi:hypothetical protein
MFEFYETKMDAAWKALEQAKLDNNTWGINYWGGVFTNLQKQLEKATRPRRARLLSSVCG